MSMAVPSFDPWTSTTASADIVISGFSYFMSFHLLSLFDCSSERMPGRWGTPSPLAGRSLVRPVCCGRVYRVLRLAAVGRAAGLRSVNHFDRVGRKRDLGLFVFHEFSPPFFFRLLLAKRAFELATARSDSR